MVKDRSSENSKRTILYYPTIAVPSSSWLRQALLYWDEVASIVPGQVEEDHHGHSPFTADVEYLRTEGEFRSVRPETLLKRRTAWANPETFTTEFQTLVNSPSVKRMLGSKDGWQLTAHIHRDKLTVDLLRFLQEQGLAKRDDQEPYWCLVEEKTALLYMSVLAKYLADTDTQFTVPGTDRREYERLVYEAPSHWDGFACLDIRFGNALPIPRADAPLSDILEFKRRRRQELLHFREQLDDFQDKLAKATDAREVKQLVVSFRESMEKQIANLNAVLCDGRIETVAGSLKALLGVDSPTSVGAAAVSLGVATKIAEVPIEWTVGGLAIAGVVRVGHYLVSKHNEQRAAVRNTPFAYLYHAQTESLVLA